MATVDFLIASNRDPSTYALRVADSIRALPESQQGLTRVLVCSPNPILDDRVVWVPEPKPLGPIGAFNLLCEHSASDYLQILSDDAELFDTDFFSMIDFLEGPVYRDRKYKVTCPVHRGHFPYCVAGTNFPILGTPFVSRDTLAKLGGHIFNPRFFYHVADCWLAYFVGSQGEMPLLYAGTQLHIFELGNAKNPDSDNDHAQLEWLKDNHQGNYLA